MVGVVGSSPIAPTNNITTQNSKEWGKVKRYDTANLYCDPHAVTEFVFSSGKKCGSTALFFGFGIPELERCNDQYHPTRRFSTFL